ncbi:site-specific integrase, partial [Puniceicoccaceae bacterium K14]|nr:site-specific integrase [Puniceicoccaceae bacterium K14]
LVCEYFEQDPKLLKEEQIASYIVHLKEVKRWAPSTVRQSIACMSLFYNDMLGRQWRLWEVVTMRERRKLPVVLTTQETKALFANVALRRHLTPLRLMYCCGLRVDELVHLTIDDIDPTRILVREGKGSKDRYVPLPPAMHRELRRYWKEHRNP